MKIKKKPTEEQINFLESEGLIHGEELEGISKEKWHSIRERLYVPEDMTMLQEGLSGPS